MILTISGSLNKNADVVTNDDRIGIVPYPVNIRIIFYTAVPFHL